MCATMINPFHMPLVLNYLKNLRICLLIASTYSKDIHNPNASPYRTWLRLWAPRYIRESGMRMTEAIDIQILT